MNPIFQSFTDDDDIEIKNSKLPSAIPERYLTINNIQNTRQE
jgi:hypothetical protein